VFNSNQNILPFKTARARLIFQLFKLLASIFFFYFETPGLYVSKMLDIISLFFNILLTVHLNIFILILTNLMH